MSGPVFFESEAAFRRWLEANHAEARELLVGFWKKGSGRPSIDWSRARDQALCFGWIDGVRKSLGEDSYTIRFTPRRKASIWSKVNLARFEALKAAGQMTEAGERALAENDGRRAVYAYENAVPTSATRRRRSSAAMRRRGPTGNAGRRAIARSCFTGSPVRKGRTRARGGWPH